MSSPPAEIGSFKTPDGADLQTTTFKTSGAPKAIIYHLHGFSDHAGRYADFFPTLAAAGIECHVLDQRGWGHSVQKPVDKGNTGGTPQVMADITGWLKTSPVLSLSSTSTASETPKVPIFLSGHSMGGGEVLYYAARGPKEIIDQLSGVIAVAPWITLDPATQPWKITVVVGRLVSKLLPRFQLVQKLDPSFLSHDEVANQTWVNDPLCHNTATLQTYDGCLTRAHELFIGKALPQPQVKRIWLGHGEADRITSPEGSKAYRKLAKHNDMTFKLYPDTRHAIHIEPDTKEEFFKDIIDFILVGTKAEPQSKL